MQMKLFETAKYRASKLLALYDEYDFIDELLRHTAQTRMFFGWYMAEGGDKQPTATFEGRVVRKSNEYILIKGINITFTAHDGTIIRGYEDHALVKSCKEFREAGIKEGDSVRFSGTVGIYWRENNEPDRCDYDFEIKQVINLEIVDNYVPYKTNYSSSTFFDRFAKDYYLLGEMIMSFYPQERIISNIRLRTFDYQWNWGNLTVFNDEQFTAYVLE